MAEDGDSITESPVPQEALRTSVVEKAEEAMAASDRVLGLSKLPNWLGFWVPIVTALFSLVIAVFSLLISTQDPEVVLIMPSHVLMDISDRSDSAPYVPQNIYLQPNFVGTGNNSRVELINRMTLKIEPEGAGPSTTLDWSEQGHWQFAEGTDALSLRSYTYDADAAPLLVSPSNAQQPLCVFPLTTSYELKPGIKYRLTLTADRAVASKSLAGSVIISVTKQQIDFLKENAQTQQYLDLTARPPGG